MAGFANMAQSLEPILRGPGFDDAWGRVTNNVFRLGDVSPEVREIVESTCRVRQEIVLGYWQDLFERTPAELDEWTLRASVAIRQSGVPFVGLFGQDPSDEEVAWIRSNLPEARTLVWPGSGHFPHLAHPRRFAELLAETNRWAGDRILAEVPV